MGAPIGGEIHWYDLSSGRPVFECAKMIVAWLFLKSQVGNQ